MQDAMISNEVIEKVREVVRHLPGVREVIFCDPALRDKVIELEKAAESNGAVGGMMSFKNKGVWDSMEREYCFFIIVDPEEPLNNYGSNPITMVDEAGQVVGEWVDEEKAAMLRERDDVHFMSDDFVIYEDVDVVGTPYFVIQDMGFHYIEGVKGLENVSSGSISGPADDFLRKRFGYGDTRCWTHIIGFDTTDPE
jgi:hypothetical protein